MADFELTFLGTGTSVGIPMIGCDCETCHSTDPRDNRTRASIYLRTPEAAWVVDTGPEFRIQCLRENVRQLDAALYTHPHMDHVTGFDDLRRFTTEADRFLPIYAMPSCLEKLEQMYVHAFNGENRYRGYLKPFPKPIHGPFHIGETEITPLPVIHGKVETVGYLFSRRGRKLCAYFSDCKLIPELTTEAMRGVDTLIIDALRHTPHPTHLNFQEALEYQKSLKPHRTYLTHFQCEVMHARDERTLPPDVRLAYDGLKLVWD